MKAALRVPWLLFTMFPIQRWLGVIGLLLLVVAWLTATPFAALGLIFLLLAPVMTGGVMLRNMAAPRTLRLIPHGRVRLLSGIALSVLVITALVVPVAWTMMQGAASNAPITLTALTALVVAIVSILLLSQFVLASQPYSMTLWFMGLAALSLSLHYSGLLKAAAASVGFLAGVTVVCWAAFVIWFLRARAFPINESGTMGSRRVIRVGSSSADAIRTLLLGQPRLIWPFAAGLLLCALAGGPWLLTFAFTQRYTSVPDLLTKAMLPAVYISAILGTTGMTIARRSRLLWLTGGLDRAQLFRMCESYAWRFFLAGATPIFLLVATAWLLNPAAGAFVGLVLLLQLGAGVCLLYFGLMHVRGWTAADVVIAILLGGGWLAQVIVATQSSQDDLMRLSKLIVGAVVIAVSLRSFARHRWQRIDWLHFRPLRAPSQGARLTH